MVKIIVSGIAGRMGMRIGALGAADKDIEVAGALEAKDHASVGKDIGNVLSVKNIGKSVADDLEKIKDSPCVLIEFTSAPVTMAHLQIATKKKIGMVIGPTAISHQEIEIFYLF